MSEPVDGGSIFSSSQIELLFERDGLCDFRNEAIINVFVRVLISLKVVFYYLFIKYLIWQSQL